METHRPPDGIIRTTARCCGWRLSVMMRIHSPTVCCRVTVITGLLMSPQPSSPLTGVPGSTTLRA